MAPHNDLADSATALNRALGNLGGRQKSWMHHAPIPSPTLTPAHLTAQPLPLTVKLRGRHPPSNSTSPQPANAVSSNVNPDTRPVTVLPSPTPSEETMRYVSQPSQPTTPATPVTQNIDLFAPAQTTYTPNTPLETVFMDAARTAGSAQKRPAEETTNKDKRGRIGIAGPPRPPPAASAVQHQHNQPAGMPLPPQGHLHQQNQVRRQSCDHVTHGSSQPPQPRQQAQQPPWYTVGACLRIMAMFQATYPIPPEHENDRTRLIVLRQATEAGDWSYLTMHQYYCLYDYRRQSVPAEIREDPAMATACRTMHSVLASNDCLSPTVLAFFSTYPYPITEIHTQWPVSFENHKQSFRIFISKFTNFEQLRNICQKRGFPPRVRELVHFLGVNSTTFQRMVFTAVIRQTWRFTPNSPTTKQLEDEALRLFLHDQNSYYLWSGVAVNGQSGSRSQQQAQHDAQILSAQYQQLHQAYVLTVHNRSSATQGPHYHMPSHAPQPLQQPHFLASNATNMRPNSYQVPAHATRRQAGRAGPVRGTFSANHQLRANRSTHLPVQEPVRLLPTSGRPPPPLQRIPYPARFGLHQAHLRSPVLKAQTSEAPFCHFVQGYIKLPKRLSTAGHQVERWTFNVESEVFQSLAPLAKGPPGAPDMRIANANSTTARLRCIKWPVTEGPPDEHTWTITETTWVPFSYVTLNGTPLDQRKKLHHGKDLPIDVTGLLKEGQNVLEATVMLPVHDTSYHNYLLAMELLGVLPFDMVVRRCVEEQHVSAQEVTQAIQRKLSGTIDDDDEILVVESTLTINLFDPFSASKYCDIPARSKACLHNDCFDLETFLSTRTRKGDATTADQWRCPICKADARPQHLLVDGFLEKVKAELLGQGLAETRAIVVQQDGSWKAKAELRDPNGVFDNSPTPKHVQLAQPARAAAAAAEVINLDD